MLLRSRRTRGGKEIGPKKSSAYSSELALHIRSLEASATGQASHKESLAEAPSSAGEFGLAFISSAISIACLKSARRVCRRSLIKP